MTYYVNSDDGLVSFDLPCEVHQKKKSKENLLQRITSALSLRRSKSEECPISKNEEKAYTTAATSLQNSPEPKEEPSLPINTSMVPSMVPSESYLLEKAFNLQPHEDDVASISSDELIQSFYSDIVANDVYYDYARLVYCDGDSEEKEQGFFNENYEKELEREELRLQMIKELY